MKILYIGNHNQPNNDDEGAISWGFRELGHTVTEVHENSNIESIRQLDFSKFDFALFHKSSPHVIKEVSNHIDCVLWFFDGINKGFEFNDTYITEVKNYFTYMFFTDGDYVKDCNNSKIISLKQGFDSRVIRRVDASNYTPQRCISFLGNINHSGYNDRYNYCRAVKEKYDNLFICDLNFNMFKEKLTDYCQSTRILLAMPPVTDLYWSNRVYVLGGRGALIIHPYSKQLLECVPMLPTYSSIPDLLSKIDYYLANPRESLSIRMELQETIISKYTYKDRCNDLVNSLHL